MANHKSAEKRARQSLKKRARNKSYLSSVRTAIKELDAAVVGKEKAEKILTLFTKCQSKLGKAAQKGLVHHNNAARKIGRLAKRSGLTK